MMNEEQKVETVKVELPMEAWDVVANALAQRSYVEVWRILAAIQQQVALPQVPMDFGDEVEDFEKKVE